MAEKDNSKQARVTVEGRLTDTTSPSGVMHRLFRYHVSISKPDRPQAQVYDRELHIRERVHQANAPTATDTKQSDALLCHESPIATDCINSPATSSEHQDQLNSNPEAVSPAADLIPDDGEIDMDDVDGDELDLPDAITDQPPVVTDTSPVVARATFPALTFRPALPQIKARLNQARQTLQHLLPDLHRRIRFPHLKPSPGRKLFSHRVGNTGRLILLLAGVGLVGTLFYLLPDRPPATATPTHKPATTTSDSDQAQPPPTYHARIEKSPNGVIITLQGPESEQVLTRLPPGYHPVVQGNKIVHIVTPGNTLWFIAKRYIKDPFRYPELVQLNHIKNPDLIYPGEQVIIQYIRQSAP